MMIEKICAVAATRVQRVGHLKQVAGLPKWKSKTPWPEHRISTVCGSDCHKGDFLRGQGYIEQFHPGVLRVQQRPFSPTEGAFIADLCKLWQARRARQKRRKRLVRVSSKGKKFGGYTIRDAATILPQDAPGGGPLFGGIWCIHSRDSTMNVWAARWEDCKSTRALLEGAL